jgi:hypothetical protein
MALTNQYLILNPSLKRIGTLTVDGATKFSNDSVSKFNLPMQTQLVPHTMMTSV